MLSPPRDRWLPRAVCTFVVVVVCAAALSASAVVVVTAPVAVQPVCPSRDLFSSQCKGSGSYFVRDRRGIKGSCCLHLPAGTTANCLRDTWLSLAVCVSLSCLRLQGWAGAGTYRVSG